MRMLRRDYGRKCVAWRRQGSFIFIYVPCFLTVGTVIGKLGCPHRDAPLFGGQLKGTYRLTKIVLIPMIAQKFVVFQESLLYRIFQLLFGCHAKIRTAF